MKNRKKVIAVAALLAVLSLLFYFSNRASPEPLQPRRRWVPCPACRPKNRQPKTCLPKGLAGAEAPNFEISPEKQQLIGVKVAAAQLLPLMKTIRTVGLVEYDQRRQQTINTKVEGWFEKLYVNFVGVYVKKGDPVADIYSPELGEPAGVHQCSEVGETHRCKEGRAGTEAASQAGAPDVNAMIEGDARSLVEAARQRLKLYDISDAQIKKIEESEKPIRTLTIYSPYNGYVLQKNVNQGSRVMPGADLLDVADLSMVWITADIYEYEMPLIKSGRQRNRQS